MARKKIRLLLLDANVVIELHSLELWEHVVERCEILLTETVVEEARYYDAGEQHVRIAIEQGIDDDDRIRMPAGTRARSRRQVCNRRTARSVLLGGEDEAPVEARVERAVLTVAAVPLPGHGGGCPRRPERVRNAGCAPPRGGYHAKV